MTHEKLHERVDVLTAFTAKSLRPLVFKWRNKKYKVLKTTLTYHQFDGRESVHYFSVTDSANYFKLAFYTKNLTWYIEEIYNEG